jgi:hypothetical protein
VADRVDAVSFVPAAGLWLQRSCSFDTHRCMSIDWSSRSFAACVGNAHIVPVEASKYKQKSVTDFLQDLSLRCLFLVAEDVTIFDHIHSLTADKCGREYAQERSQNDRT